MLEIDLEKEILERFGNRLKETFNETPLKEIYLESLTLFYRLLFTLYRKNLGLEPLDMNLYRGGIFDPEAHPLLEGYRMDGGSFDRFLDLIKYSKMDIRYPGRVYERILDYTPCLSEKGDYYLEYGSISRRRAGSYYTPDLIIRYIVESTLGPLIRGELRKAPLSSEEILELKILDPAMGSGYFLLSAIDYLAGAYSDALIREGRESSPENLVEIRRRIAERCIYGVDVDPMAVELAKLSIWLSTMDQHKPPVFLNHHLKCGNSLVGARLSDLKNGSDLNIERLKDDLVRHTLQIMDRRTGSLDDIKEKSRVEERIELIKQPLKNELNSMVANISDRFFHWEIEFPEVFFGPSDERKGFTAIVGNPPYVGQKDNKPLFDSLLRSPIVREYYEGKMDLWYLFAELSLDLSARHALIGILATEYWMSAEGASILRKNLCERASFKRLLFFNGSVFEGAPGIHSNIILFSNDPSPNSPPADLFCLKAENRAPACFSGLSSLPLEWFSHHLSPAKKDLPKDGGYINFKSQKAVRAGQWQDENGTRTLGEICDIYQGIVPGPDFVGRRAWRNLTDLERKSIRPGEPVFVLPADHIERLNLSSRERELLRPFYPARELTPVSLCKDAQHSIIYLSQQTVRSLSEFPNIRRHLEQYRPLMDRRRETARGSKPWYHLHWPRQEALFFGPKIIAVRQTRHPLFTYSDRPTFLDLSVNIARHKQNDSDLLKVITLYLNTVWIRDWLEQNGKMKGDIYQIDRGPLEKIPIPRSISERGRLYRELLEIFLDLERDRLSIEEAILQAEERTTKTQRHKEQI
jgi:adenine-specific DNA-methyltransferase